MKRKGTGRILSPAQYEELLELVAGRDERCWFADVIPHACSGEGQAAHLIPQAALKRHAPHGIVKRRAKLFAEDGSHEVRVVYLPASRIDSASPWDDRISLTDLARDARNVVYACSFIHRIFDDGFYRHKDLNFPRALLEPRFEAFVTEFNLERLAAARFPTLIPDDFDNPLGVEEPDTYAVRD